MKLKVLDVAVPLAGILAAALFVRLYYDDVAKSAGQGREPIGTVVYKRKVAQRRLMDSPVWEGVAKGGIVYNHDAIRTVADSEATITFKDDTQIGIGENSLVVLDFGEEGGRIDFVEGSLRTDSPAAGAAGGTAGGSAGSAPARLTVVSGGTELDVSKGSADLSKDKGGTMTVDVTEGSVDVKSGGQTRAVDSAERAVVRESADERPATVQVQAVPVTPVAPAQGAFLLAKREGGSATFSWKTAEGAKSVVELSADRAFAAVAASAETTKASATLAVRPGVWWWRVRADAAESRVVKFTVIEDAAPELLSPADGASFAFRETPKGVRVSWSAVEYATAYEWEASADPSFRSVVASGSTEAEFAVVTPKAEGPVYWRVKPVFGFGGLGTGSVSAPRVFRSARQAAPAAPSPLAPPDGASFAERDVQNRGVVFSWNAVDEAARWVLEISADPAFATIAAKAETEDAFARVKAPLAPGRYLWRVRYETADGAMSPASAIRAVVVAPKAAPPEALSPADGYAVEEGSADALAFAWKGDAAAWRFRLSKARNLSSPAVELELGRASVSLPAPEAGTWYWSAVPADEPDAAPAFTRTIVVLARVPVPILDAPAEGARLELAAEPARFSWKPVDGAASYRFALASAEGRILFEEQAPATSVAVPAAKIPSGDATWSVAARSADGRVGTASRRAIAFERARTVEAPAGAEPADGASVAGLVAARDGVLLRWTSAERGATFVVTVSTDPEFSKPSSKTETSSNSHRLENPAPGRYYWKVGGVAADGMAIPESRPVSFTVAPVPPLDTPARLSPAEGAVVDMSKSSYLDFSWTAVKDAAKYDITLTERKTGRTVFTETTTTNRYRFTKLESLDVGAFSWTVTAVSKAEAGLSARSSAAAKASFTIKIVQPAGTTGLVSPSVIYVEE